MKKVVPLHYIKQAVINFKISMIITIIAEIIVLVSNAKSGKYFHLFHCHTLYADFLLNALFPIH